MDNVTLLERICHSNIFVRMVSDQKLRIVNALKANGEIVAMSNPIKQVSSFFSRKTFIISLVQGLVVLLTALIVLGDSLKVGASAEVACAVTFTTVVVSNVGLILVNRSWQHSMYVTLRSSNPALWRVTGAAFSFLLLVLTLPFFREVFHFSSISFYQRVLSVLAGLSSVVWFELFKVKYLF